MPCYDSRSSDPVYVENPLNREMKTRLDNVTRMLCAVCGKIESGYSFNFDSVPGLTKWWREHQEEDRLEEEKRKKRRAAERTKKLNELASLKEKVKKLEKEVK